MTRVIAHRGNSSEAPENTLASFESAIAAGVPMLECDVQMTKDGALVVIHDPTLERTGGHRGDVREMTLDDVRAVDVSYPSRFGASFAPARVLTLEELLRTVKGRARVMIEVKKDSSRPDDDRFERRIAETLRASGLRVAPDDDTDVALISFATPILARFADLIPECPRGHLFYQVPIGRALEASKAASAGFLMPFKGDLTPEFLEGARARNLGVATWVSDDEAEFRELMKLGLLGIGTNRPRVMRALTA